MDAERFRGLIYKQSASYVTFPSISKKADGLMPHELITAADIAALYKTVLKREVDASAKVHWATVTTDWKLTRGRLFHILTQSEEFANHSQAHKDEVLSLLAQETHPAEAVHWFHTLRLDDGYETNGMLNQDVSQQGVFKYPVVGKTVLDMGAWDGLFSFEAERRGAERVLATDWFCWSGPGWGTKAGFDFAHNALASKVEAQEIPIEGLSADQIGTFDVGFFLGVFYHLPDPYEGLKRAASMVTERLVLITHTEDNDLEIPVMRYVEGIAGDDTTFWYPNRACLQQMLHAFGFSKIEFVDIDNAPNGHHRDAVHAWR